MIPSYPCSQNTRFHSLPQTGIETGSSAVKVPNHGIARKFPASLLTGQSSRVSSGGWKTEGSFQPKSSLALNCQGDPLPWVPWAWIFSPYLTPGGPAPPLRLPFRIQCRMRWPLLQARGRGAVLTAVQVVPRLEMGSPWDSALTKGGGERERGDEEEEWGESGSAARHGPAARHSPGIRSRPNSTKRLEVSFPLHRWRGSGDHVKRQRWDSTSQSLREGE